jgi:hypothetical protein
MSFTISKKNGELIYEDHGGYESRNPSTFWCIQQSDKIYNFPDFKEITIFTGDNGSYSTVPDFNFHCWPQVGIDDYKETCEQISLKGLQKALVFKAGWIGALSHFTRKIMCDIQDDNCECILMNWNRENPNKLFSHKYLSLPELVEKYAVLIDIQGAGYSGRLKYLLWSTRPFLQID